jgi:hypothetical protein
MKTKQSWQVSRNGIARSDGERRWEYAYQFLLQWTMQSDTGTPPISSALAQEDDHGNRSVCPRVDQPPATRPDD